MPTLPWFVGDQLPHAQVTTVDDLGNLVNDWPNDVTKFVVTFYDVRLNTNRSGTGTVAIVSQVLGQFTYAWSAADVANEGVFDMYVTITYPSGEPSTFFIERLTMLKRHV